MTDHKIILSCLNLRDFYKYRWFIILLLVIWGGALLIFLFWLKWFLIVAFVAVYFSFRRAFRIEIRLQNDTFQIRKQFLGLWYRIIKITYNKVIYFSDSGLLQFQGINKSMLIGMNDTGLVIQKLKFMDTVCTGKDAENIMNRLVSTLKNHGNFSEVSNSRE